MQFTNYSIRSASLPSPAPSSPSIAMSVPHWTQLSKQVNLPTPRSVVHREECTQCFDSQDSPLGIDVCLTCFNGGCVHFKHAANHAAKTGHSLALNLKRVRKTETHHRSPSEEPPLKKLAIPEPTNGADQFDLNTSVVYYPPGDNSKRVLVSDPIEPKVQQAVAAILASSSSAQVNEVKAWEEEIETCHHVTELKQDASVTPAVQASATCHGCELSSNLWLCLRCGSLGCGRPQYGGTGGNGHALQHYELTGHCVNVKLGTITAEGSADLYCYSCDDARTDALLQEHLSHFSIEIAKQEKTEKSMTELQVEHNLKFDFSMSGVEGGELRPIQGPGFTGLKNLGNSCYIASVLQVLFALPPFKKRFFNEMFESHSLNCQAINPAECFECQMNKIAHGILSGRYAISSHTASQQKTADGSHPNAPIDLPFQEGIKPMMFKALIGKGHPEFSTMRQQDADEFMRYFFEFIRRQLRQTLQNLVNPPAPNLDEMDLDPTLPFRFELEEKLQCTTCLCVRYRYEEQDALSLHVPAIPVLTPTETEVSEIKPPVQPPACQPVSLEDCLKDFTTPQPADYNCPRCKQKTTALTTSRIASLPKYLIVHARRFAVINWVPQKLEIPVTIQDHRIDLESYIGSGPQPGEETLPDIEQIAPAVDEVPVNPETLSALESMGFPTARCRKAILETGDSGVENAANWLFEHMDDVEVDVAQPAQQLSFNDEHVSMLMDMGFTSSQAKKALGETDGNLERAVEWLFSHPDDSGLEAISEPNQNGSTVQNEEAEKKNAGIRYGDKNLPARFKLKAFISHKGPSVFSGHYVAHIRSEDDVLIAQKGDRWVLFNDEKVAIAEHGPLSADSLAP